MSNKDVTEILEDDSVVCKFFKIDYKNEVSNEDLVCDVNNIIHNISDNYLWHKESLRVNSPFTQGTLHCLYSVTSFGENIEDEWFIVYMVTEISKLRNLAVQIFDSDGEFLLIEAADYLPAWAHPENTQNRVFIFKGKLHIIPPHRASIETKLELKEAIKILTENFNDTLASPEVHAAINRRIEKYPKAIGDNVHNAILKLPIEIATLLSLKPDLISCLVNRYCNHDCMDEYLFKDINTDFNNWATVTIKFTKCLYAMLKSSKTNKHITIAMQKANETDKRLICGLKLTLGYLILMAKSSSSTNYEKYHMNLKNSGYYKDNLEDSKDYTVLSKNAKDYFAETESLFSDDLSEKIQCLITSSEFDIQKQKIVSGFTPLVEDDENWLNIEPNKLDDFLDKTYRKDVVFRKDDSDAHVIMSEISNFIKQKSDFEGVETDTTEEINEIKFNPEEFVSSITNMLKVLTNDTNSDCDENESEDFMNTDNQSDNDSCEENIEDESQKSIYRNIITSLKEEGSYGPTSTVLKNIGIEKLSILPSEDDERE